ncbi:ABC transporter ATP-binding protein [Nocardioides sp. Bht2]|uniref:ABC transporter ATP-binding protein n=1 Tax=Nocardioides sp. Bht2 TaxID=3392297 RepID=UPI0039B5281D
MTPLLRVKDLGVQFKVRGGRRLQAVRGLSFEIAPRETVALVGESGSGKSTAARAVLRLVKSSSGTVEINGQEITTMRPRELARFRRHAQMVFQDPYSSLDPSMTIAESLAEPLRFHTELTRGERRSRAEELLEQVGLRREHADRYPHEFSGGQRQRIAIARAIALNPSLLVADEAVSALDVSSQNQILLLLKRLSDELGIGCLFISHDLAVVRNLADRILVMYLGHIVEEGPTQSVFESPRHPYTAALLSAALVADPKRQAERRRVQLTGELPDPTNPPKGCVFSTRCPQAQAICHQEAPVSRSTAVGGSVACHFELTPSNGKREA